MSTYFDLIMIPLQLLIVFFTIYYFTLSFFGLFGRRPEEKIYDEQKTFAMIVCAHNEEQVIGQLVENLHLLNYSDHLYDIFVVADNCKDNTAQIARQAGAIVYERFNDNEKGKGFAMDWMFQRLFEMERQYDAVCVFDADNLVHPNFLREMNSRLCKGERLIQGYLDSKNPNDTWISGVFSISFWVVNHVWHLAKYNIGLSSCLGGTGMCISTDILRRHGWGATCLTEDMEFTMKLSLNDTRVAFAYDAVVYDEKPLTLKQSWRQRVRWMQGHCDVASRYFFKLIKKGIKERKLSCIDCAVYLVQPIRIIATGIITFFAYAQTFHPDGDLGFIQLSYIFGNSWLWNVIVILQFCYTPFVIWYERREFKPKMVLYYFTYILYNFTWVPIAIQGMIGKNKTEWSHTKHTRTISMEELNRLNSK